MTEVEEIKRILTDLEKFLGRLPKESKDHREIASDIEYWKRQLRKKENAPVSVLTRT
jgi:hypothetical protein